MSMRSTAQILLLTLAGAPMLAEGHRRDAEKPASPVKTVPSAGTVDAEVVSLVKQIDLAGLVAARQLGHAKLSHSQKSFLGAAAYSLIENTSISVPNSKDGGEFFKYAMEAEIGHAHSVAASNSNAKEILKSELILAKGYEFAALRVVQYR